jgi:c-di-AMP phosphodiesterase-like protein
MPIIILILIGVAIYAIVTIGFQSWLGICLAALCVMLLIALNESKPKQKKDDDDNDFMGM